MVTGKTYADVSMRFPFLQCHVGLTVRDHEPAGMSDAHVYQSGAYLGFCKGERQGKSHRGRDPEGVEGGGLCITT